MSEHKVGTKEEWLAARLELLEAEKEHSRRGDELAAQRQALPWVAVEKEYEFETEDGSASLADLFCGRSQLMIYHFMFGPDYDAGCPSCSAIADGFNGSVVHLANHDLMFWAVSRAPLEKLEAYKQRMGWEFPWASSSPSDFNQDFAVSWTREQLESGVTEDNFRSVDVRPQLGAPEDSPWVYWLATVTGVDWPTYLQEAPGLSAFALEDGVVYHTYSSYRRGVDAIWGMYPWLDRAPLGRNEAGPWWRRHDEYESD
jgi:predicted dithiol-disulfide oxidoreductase (DUF899 family)